VREHVRSIKTRLQLGLRVLSGVAAGNPRFAATKLEELQELCQPLLSSKLVGGLGCRTAAHACRAFVCAVLLSVREIGTVPAVEQQARVCMSKTLEAPMNGY
jgi:hypothetical protein